MPNICIFTLSGHRGLHVCVVAIIKILLKEEQKMICDTWVNNNTAGLKKQVMMVGWRYL